jgi:hypothetical protein
MCTKCTEDAQHLISTLEGFEDDVWLTDTISKWRLSVNIDTLTPDIKSLGAKQLAEILYWGF